jgi:TldD protein
MPRMLTRRDFALAAAAIASALRASAQNAPAQASTDDDPILRAMRDELARSNELRVVGGADEAPYYISYTLSDAESFRVSASMGAPIGVSENHFRAPLIEVRVGSYDLDHTGHIFSGIYTGSRFDGEWPLDDNYATLREGFWLSTDRAYKTALESMARKRAALSSSNASTEKLADFSKAEPVRSIAKITRKKIDQSLWTARTVKLSAIFNAYPDVLASVVEFQDLPATTYLMNSEGTTLRYDDSGVSLYTTAEGQAPDGMLLHDAATFQAFQPEQLPPESDVQKAFAAVAENIRALVHAPAGEEFSGPTLFEPQAAAQLLAQLLGDNLRVPRKPLADPGRPVNFVASELETKLGSRVLPDWIDIVDDPTQTAWHGKPLAGYYAFDLEGVPGKAVPVVEKGVLKNFLTTRQPIRGFASSNGHARLQGRFGARSAAISNLFVNATGTVPLADLKKKLMDLCKDRGKPYGMLVRKLDYPFSSGRSELQSLASAGAQSGGSVQPLSPPVLVYRVYADGREELVRGLRFRGVSTRSLRDILGASQETALFEYINNAAPLAMLGAGGYMAPTSVVAPAMLFDEIEFELPRDQLPKPPVVPPPDRGTA